MGALLHCENVCKSYGKFQALNSISLDIPTGRIVGILGPNGSGKTTLIKSISGLLIPEEGVITVSGKPVGVESKGMVSYLPERPYFSTSLKVGETLDFFQEFYQDFQREAAEGMLRTLQINEKSKIGTLSKGNREKLQLVLVMSRRAKLYLLDEPIGGVDPAARDFILRTILGNYNGDSTILISTHLIQDVEKVLDDVIFIRCGNVVLHKSVDEIRQEEQKSVDTLFREVFAC